MPRYRDGTSIGSDLCPGDWFKVRSSHNSSQCCDYSCFGRWSWMFCFLCCCLPVCYPCYLTRMYRDRWKHSSRLRSDLKCKSCPNLVAGGQEFDVSLSRQGSCHSHSQGRLQGCSESESGRVIEERKKKAEDLIELDVMMLHSGTATDLTKKMSELNFLALDESGIQAKVIIQADKRVVNVVGKLQRNKQDTEIVKLKSILETPITKENDAIGANSMVLMRKAGKGKVSDCRDQEINIGRLERQVVEQRVIVEKDVEEENIFKIPDVPRKPSSEKLDDNEEDISTPGSFYSRGCRSGTETPRSDQYYSCNSSLYSHRAEETLKDVKVLQDTPTQPYQVAEDESETENIARVKSNVGVTTEAYSNSQDTSPETQFLVTHFGPNSIELNINNHELGDNGTKDGSDPSKEVNSIPAIEVDLANEVKCFHKCDFFNIKRLGWRREEVAGINVKLNLMMEPDLTCWKMDDIKEFATTQLPSLDIIVTVWRKEEELKDMLDKETGMLSYIRKYWTGFFLFLLVEVQSDPLSDDYLLRSTVDTEHKKVDNPSSPDMFRKARSLFGDCHRIMIHESDLATGNLSFVTESMARFFCHSKLFNCTRFGGSGMENMSLANPDWICPDLCQLRAIAPSAKTRKKVRRGFFKSFRRVMIIRKGISQRVGEGSKMQTKKQETRLPKDPQLDNFNFEEDKS